METGYKDYRTSEGCVSDWVLWKIEGGVELGRKRRGKHGRLGRGYCCVAFKRHAGRCCQDGGALPGVRI